MKSLFMGLILSVSISATAAGPDQFYKCGTDDGGLFMTVKVVRHWFWGKLVSVQAWSNEHWIQTTNGTAREFFDKDDIRIDFVSWHITSVQYHEAQYPCVQVRSKSSLPQQYKVTSTIGIRG